MRKGVAHDVGKGQGGHLWRNSSVFKLCQRREKYMTMVSFLSHENEASQYQSVYQWATGHHLGKEVLSRTLPQRSPRIPKGGGDIRLW